jgi:excisionase family DNA binding protein
MLQSALYTDKEAAEYLRISQVTLWKYRRDRKISFIRLSGKVLYKQEQLDALLETQTRKAE